MFPSINLKHTLIIPFHNSIYFFTLTVTDTGGLSDSDSLTVTVDNVPPNVYAGPDQIADEGQALSFSEVFTDPGVLDTHDISWDFGDGTVLSSTLTTAHVYGDDGIYTVTLAVSDNDGGVGSDSLVVTVTNVAPIVYAGEDQTVEVGQVVYFTGVFTDPGTLDTHTRFWSLGDGYRIDDTDTPSHTYTTTERYPVTFTVTDDDGGVGQDLVFITVEEPPVVEYKVILPLVVK